MFRPLISANVRSTARRSAPWKSRLTGCPVNWRSPLRCGADRLRRRRRLRRGGAGERGDCRRRRWPRPRWARAGAGASAAGGTSRRERRRRIAAGRRLQRSASRRRRRRRRRRAGGSTYGAAFADGLSKSTTTVLRSLRTRCATGCASAIRTREAGAPSDVRRFDGDRRDGALRVGREPSWRRLGADVAEVDAAASADPAASRCRPTGSVASMTSDAPSRVHARADGLQPRRRSARPGAATAPTH